MPKRVSKQRLQHEDPSRVRKVAAIAALESIRLSSLEASLDQPPDTLVGEHAYSTTRAAEVQRRLGQNEVEILVTLDVALQRKPSDGWGGIKLKVSLIYSFNGDVPPDDELEVFARLNAVYNAWPYLRELVQSLTVRMGLPALTLPLYRVTAPVPKKAATSS